MLLQPNRRLFRVLKAAGQSTESTEHAPRGGLGATPRRPHVTVFHSSSEAVPFRYEDAEIGEIDCLRVNTETLVF